MSRIRRTTRHLCRTVIARHWRQLNHAHVRPLGGFERGPDFLTQMLASFRRAIRAYRRLANLAPSYYDPAVVNREALAREDQRRWMASWEPALEKAYGPLTPGQREAQRQADLRREQPAPLHPNTQRAVNRQLADFEFWKTTGDASRARYQEFQRRRPHYLPSLGKVAQLMEIAFDFRWIATGLDWRKSGRVEGTAPPFEQDWEADLRRSYGGNRTESADQQPTMTASVAQASAPRFPSAALPSRSNESDVSPKTETELKHRPAPLVNHIQTTARPSSTDGPTTPDTAVQPVPAYCRRDAWASLARHQRQRSR